MRGGTAGVTSITEPRNVMSEEDEKPKPAYAPLEQSILPGYRNYVARPPKDWRSWENGRGEKVDAPKYRGQQFTGKIIPPLTDSHGNPIKEGSFQIVRNAKGELVIIDWSLPVLGSVVADASGFEGEDDGKTQPIMGRHVYRTRGSLDQAKAALAVLVLAKKERLAGVPSDPAQCHDLAGKPVRIGQLALCEFKRGKLTGRFVIVDHGRDIISKDRGLVLKAKTFKQAVASFIEKSKTWKVPRKKKIFVGPPIMFEAPAGFGGMGGFQERVGVSPDSKAWDVTVDIYARTGKWCTTAKLIWAGQYPPELIEQCENYRQEYLENPESFYDDLKPEPISGTQLAQELIKKQRAEVLKDPAVKAIMEVFGGALISVEPGHS